jgi:hypothetical protein
MEELASQIPIAAPPLGPCEHLQGLVGLLLRVCADPASVAHQAHGPEQIALDHEAVEAPDALLRVDPVQHQVVLDRGA